MTNSPHNVAGAANDTATATDSDRSFTIGDLAREFGVTLRTLRFYEDRGLLSPRRTAPPGSTICVTAIGFRLS